MKQNDILNKFSAKHVNRYINDLCAIGVRAAGSPGEIAAREYIKSELETYGLPVELQQFDYIHYQPLSSLCTVVFPLHIEFTSLPLQYTGNGIVQGQIVYIGEGTEGDFLKVISKKSLEGKILLTDSQMPFYESYHLAQNNKAAALIMISNAPKDLIRASTATNDRTKGNIPGVIISKKSGEKLLRLMQEGEVNVKVSSKGIYSWKKAYNIIAKIDGSESNRENIIACAHYDSQIKGCHAWDNASGVAGLLELARVFSALRPLRTILIIFFGVEEQGICWGSHAYVDYKEEANYCTALINFDGYSSKLCEINIIEVTPEVKEFVINIAKKIEWPVHKIIYPRPLSDHEPFLKKKVPCIWIHENIDPYYHTELDLLDNIDPKKIVRNLKMSGQCIYDLSHHPQYFDTLEQ